jgi:hypothetical protein
MIRQRRPDESKRCCVANAPLLAVMRTPDVVAYGQRAFLHSEGLSASCAREREPVATQQLMRIGRRADTALWVCQCVEPPRTGGSAARSRTQGAAF